MLRTRLTRSQRAISDLTAPWSELTQGDLSLDISGPDTGDAEALARALDRLRLSLRTTASSRDYLSQVIASISDAVVLTRMDGTITRVNPAAERLLGRDRRRPPGPVAGRPRGREPARRVHARGHQGADPGNRRW